jgi:hypothetical protein
MIERLNAVSASEVIGVAIVTVEERMRGWLAVIAKEKSAMRQVVGYRELALLFEFYEEFEIAPCDDAAARQLDDLRRQKLDIGSQDLKSRRRRWSTTHFSCPPTEPISKKCQVYESRTGWTDGTPGSEGVRN